MRSGNLAAKACSRARFPLLALACVPGAALAQQAPVRQFSISPQLRLSHDSNVLRLPDGVAALPGQHKADFRTSPQIGIDIVRPVGRNELYLNGLVGYDFYRYNKQLERERIGLTGGGNISTGACSINGQLYYARRQSDLDDIVASGFGNGRNRETILTPSGGISCGAGGGISSSLQYSHDDVTNSDAARAYGDYRADTYNARVGLNRPVIGDVSVYANYRHGIYDNRFVGPGQTESVKSYAAGLRLDRQFGRIKGHIAGGITRVESNAPGVRGFRGGTYDVSLAYNTQRASAFVGLGRSIQQSNLLGIGYSVTDNINTGVTYRLNPRIDLAASADWVKRRLAKSPLAPGFVGNGNDRSRTFDLRASFAAARHISLDAGATWRVRHGQAAVFDYKARILALTIRIH